MTNAHHQEHFAAFAGTSVLITGGIGFIGSNLAHRLVELGADVTLLDSMNPLYGGNMFNIAGIRDRVTVNISDLRDRHSLPYLVSGKDYIFNLGGQTSHLDSMKDPVTDLEINAAAQLSLLEACRAHAPDTRLVFASTRQLYGRPRYLPVDEAHPIKPVDVNGINKAAGEYYHILYDEVYGLRSTVLRLTNTFGPRMRIKDARQTFIGIWIRNALEGKTFEVWGGEQKRDYNYIDDVVDALLLAAHVERTHGTIYNLGGHEVLSLLDSAEALRDACGSVGFDIKEFPAERKKIDIGDYYSDYSLFAKATGWQPQVSFYEACVRTHRYYSEHLDKYL